jgi:hypothetical protein
VKGCHELAELRSTIPALASTVFDFTLVHPYAHALVSPTESDYLKHSVNHLSGLHLTAPSFGETFDLRLHNAHFPNLRVLTLQGFRITSDTAWPETPNLEFLRLRSLWFFAGAEECTWLATPKRLKRLEIINVYNDRGFVAKLFERGCDKTLEELVLYRYKGVNDPATDFRGINSLKRLKHLCQGPMLYCEIGLPSTYLPPCIEKLTIWNADEPRYMCGHLLGEYHRTILACFITNRRYVDFPYLRTIRVRAACESWNERNYVCFDGWRRELSLEEMFGEVGIHLEIDRVPGEFKFNVFWGFNVKGVSAVQRPSAPQRVLRKTVAGVKSTCSRISCGL